MDFEIGVYDQEHIGPEHYMYQTASARLAQKLAMNSLNASRSINSDTNFDNQFKDEHHYLKCQAKNNAQS